MNRFLNILNSVAQEPLSWAVVGLLVLWICMSFYKYMRCPLTKPLPDMSQGEAQAELQKKIRHPLNFAVFMLAGIALSIFGLFGLAEANGGEALKFFMLVVGVFIIVTLPLRFEIRDNETRVVAAVDPQQRGLMQDGLLVAHKRLLTYEFGILSVIVLTILIF